MSAKEKLDAAIQEYVKQLDLEPNIVSVNWVLGYETIHVNPDGKFSYTTGYSAEAGMPQSSAIGITQAVARMYMDSAIENMRPGNE